MVCSFGTLLNILALLLVFSFTYYFFGLYFIQNENKVPGDDTVSAGSLFKSLINDEKSMKDIMVLQDFDSYSWADTKASGIGSVHHMNNPDEDNFVIKVSELQVA